MINLYVSITFDYNTNFDDNLIVSKDKGKQFNISAYKDVSFNIL